MINVASPKSTTIVIDNNAVQEPSKAYSRPSGHIMFVIVNLDEQAHLVRIPASEFQPNPPAGMDPGPDNPLEAFGWHSVVVDANDVAGDYEALWRKLRERFGAGTMPRTVNLITGPSRSADIEQTLILGAHGPRRLHVMVVGKS